MTVGSVLCAKVVPQTTVADAEFAPPPQPAKAAARPAASVMPAARRAICWFPTSTDPDGRSGSDGGDARNGRVDRSWADGTFVRLAVPGSVQEMVNQ
jgi:hypothetical protein